MIKIDYICGGIENVKDFFGRQELINEIGHRLRSGQSISIYGERKIGKTSLLKYLYQVGIRQIPLPHAGQVVILYDTFGGKQDISPDAFLQGLYDELNRVMNLPVGGRQIDKNSFRKFISERHHEGKRFVFFFDEVDAASENRELDHTFFSFLRSLSDKYNVQYIIASRKSFKQLIEENNITSPFNGLFSGNLFKLQLFDEEDAYKFCRKLSQDAMAGDTIPADLIIRLAGGHPFLIRLAFYHAVNLSIKSKDNRLDYDRLKSIFEKESYHAYFYDIWLHMDTVERQMLKKVSLKILDQPLKISGKEMIDDFLGSGLVFQAKTGEYAFINHYFERYVREWDNAVPKSAAGEGAAPPDLDMKDLIPKLRKVEESLGTSVKPGECGKALEDLVMALFNAYSSYFEVREHVHSRTSSLDLHLWFKSGDDPLLKGFGGEIIVECKNWQQPVGKPEINDLAGDMVSRKCKTGILVSRKGITGKAFSDANGQRLIWFHSENSLIILVLTLTDMKSIIEEGKNLIDLLKERYVELVEG